jgi:hypothetical protein
LFLGLPLPSIATGFQNPQLCPHHWTSTRRATPDLPLRSLVELEAMPLLGAAHDGETPRFSQHASARSTLPHPSVVFHHSAAAHVCNNDLGYHFACGTITSIAALLYVIARDVAVTTPMWLQCTPNSTFTSYVLQSPTSSTYLTKKIRMLTLASWCLSNWLLYYQKLPNVLTEVLTFSRNGSCFC